MQRIPVSSSSICSVGYDPKTHTLEIEFHTGTIYQYYNVPENIYQGLMNVGSHGQYFHQNIRYIYHYEKIR